jgi:transcriptional regulator with XRE-family HTH domain
MDIVKVFGDNVREIRIQKNLSQEKLAELSGLHRTYISGIERCGRNVSLENVQRIADALEIETYKLLVEHKASSRNKVQKRKIISTND